MKLPTQVLENRYDAAGQWRAWDTNSTHSLIVETVKAQTLRTTERSLEDSGLLPKPLDLSQLRDELGKPAISDVVSSLDEEARTKRHLSLVVQEHHCDAAGTVLCANDGRKGRRWLYLAATYTVEELLSAVICFAGTKSILIWPHGNITSKFRKIVRDKGSHRIEIGPKQYMTIGTMAYPESSIAMTKSTRPSTPPSTDSLTHLDRLEAESIYIMREVMAQAENPVMLYSVGKDSAVMLHLAKKAFHPSAPPFPLLHVDTRWKFQAMYKFRDEMAEQVGMDLIVHTNPEGIAKNINPFDHGSSLHTDIMKTEGLKQALDKYNFDVAFGGARRDEEKSRAKERVFSFRNNAHRWDPKNQKPELWNLYNGYKAQGDSVRVFPLSNWTELDIWQYIYRENIPIVPLYYAAERPVVERDGMLILVDDDRIKLLEGEKVQIKCVRFRTLGCYPLTGAVESTADNLSSIVLELLESRTSEREGRAIDTDSSGSMEKKKQEGYF